ncbi:thioredoxin-like protein 2 (TLP2) [Plasmodium ovale wallikeri]|uniref:Thioredoxin-like protein 2 (TLP2) n=1 Tax=Plasmodium ovale wallikeri TaxID=864142 RepID=A0A1A8YPX0_PLAOA|nr:thioredoxin-like protein 2 (TLP2) [Plasmodium ovale wallikeri]SBT34078.1 thioredoxin-like protein 2 (TLP2) [Plasmodium ovale wallikeri]
MQSTECEIVKLLKCAPADILYMNVSDNANPFRFYIKKLGEDNDNIESLYIDIDELPELGENEDINELPTILLRKNGKYLDKIVGINEDELKKSVQKYEAE